ncbi:MAG: hypothetical protein P8Y05_08680 [Deinococcales bacterium]
MGVTLVASLRADASEACLEALMRELAALGCAARLDRARGRLECAVPFGSVTWVLHGGFAGVLRPYAACVALDDHAAQRSARTSGHRKRTPIGDRT